jgi:hypothetical protein
VGPTGWDNDASTSSSVELSTGSLYVEKCGTSMVTVSSSFSLARLSYAHWPRDTASNDATHTAEEDVLISATMRTMICEALGVMKSVEVCTQDGDATALDGTDCTEKMVEYDSLFWDHWTLKAALHDTPVHM